MELSVETLVEIPISVGQEEYPSTFISFSGISEHHFAVKLGSLTATQVPVVRLHSECVTGDVFGSLRCDCGSQLREAIKLISGYGGYILYLRQEGRGIGLAAKLRAYREQDMGADTYRANQILGFEPDLRDYAVASQMLLALGVRRIALMTNNPDKVEQLVSKGLEVTETIELPTFRSPYNEHYLRAKKNIGKHNLEI